MNQWDGKKPAWPSNWYPMAGQHNANEGKEMKTQTASNGQNEGEKPMAWINPAGAPTEFKEYQAAREVKPPAGSREQLLAEAINLHDAGVAGDKEAVVKAHDLLQRLRQSDPRNPVFEGYYGSVTALLGRDAIDPTVRFQKALEGLKILDGVVQENPQNTKVRILRAYVSLRLPEMFFHRTSTAVEDFNYLIASYQQDKTIFSEPFYWQLQYDLGSAYKNLERLQEAKTTWAKLLTETTDPKYKGLLALEGMDFPGVPSASEEGLKEASPSSPDKKKPLDQGIELHTRALTGGKEATSQAFAFFEQAYHENPGDPLTAAYYADCLSMLGRNAEDPAVMFSNPFKAMKIIDNAVNSSPDHIQLRFLRAYHSFRLPEAFFRRTATAIADFEYLIQRYQQDKTLFPRETLWQTMYDLGSAYKRLGMEKDAEAIWRKLASQGPDRKYKTLLNQQEAPSLNRRRLASLVRKEDLLKEGIHLHDLGVAGNKEAVQIACDLLKKAHEKDPADPVAQAYYGSCTALLGRDSTDPSTMFGNAIKGLMMLKRAIGRDWQNPRIRLLRAYLAYSLPEIFFHLTGRAIKDFRFVKSAFEQDNKVMPQELYWQVLYDLGAAYKRVGNNEMSDKVWKKLMEVTTDPKYQSMVTINPKE